MSRSETETTRDETLFTAETLRHFKLATPGFIVSRVKKGIAEACSELKKPHKLLQKLREITTEADTGNPEASCILAITYLIALVEVYKIIFPKNKCIQQALNNKLTILKKHLPPEKDGYCTHHIAEALVSSMIPAGKKEKVKIETLRRALDIFHIKPGLNHSRLREELLERASRYADLTLPNAEKLFSDTAKFTFDNANVDSADLKYRCEAHYTHDPDTDTSTDITNDDLNPDQQIKLKTLKKTAFILGMDYYLRQMMLAATLWDSVYVVFHGRVEGEIQISMTKDYPAAYTAFDALSTNAAIEAENRERNDEEDEEEPFPVNEFFPKNSDTILRAYTSDKAMVDYSQSLKIKMKTVKTLRRGQTLARTLPPEFQGSASVEDAATAAAPTADESTIRRNVKEAVRIGVQQNGRKMHPRSRMLVSGSTGNPEHVRLSATIKPQGPRQALQSQSVTDTAASASVTPQNPVAPEEHSQTQHDSDPEASSGSESWESESDQESGEDRELLSAQSHESDNEEEIIAAEPPPPPPSTRDIESDDDSLPPPPGEDLSSLATRMATALERHAQSQKQTDTGAAAPPEAASTEPPVRNAFLESIKLAAQLISPSRTTDPASDDTADIKKTPGPEPEQTMATALERHAQSQKQTDTGAAAPPEAASTEPPVRNAFLESIRQAAQQKANTPNVDGRGMFTLAEGSHTGFSTDEQPNAPENAASGAPSLGKTPSETSV